MQEREVQRQVLLGKIWGKVHTNTATKPPPRPPLQEQPNGVAGKRSTARTLHKWVVACRLHIWKQHHGAHPCTATPRTILEVISLGNIHLVSSLSSLPCSCLGLTRSGTAASCHFCPIRHGIPAPFPILRQERDREIAMGPSLWPPPNLLLPCVF